MHSDYPFDEKGFRLLLTGFSIFESKSLVLLQFDRKSGCVCISIYRFEIPAIVSL